MNGMNNRNDTNDRSDTEFLFQAPTVIQGALDSELDLLLNTFDVLQKQVIGGFVFYECRYKKTPILISKTKIGEICSATATALAIAHYQPRRIINQGTAGALVDWLDTGDVVIGKRICYFSGFSTDEARDIEAINPWKTDEYHSIDGDVISYRANEGLLQAVENAVRALPHRVYFDTVGSGDIWTKDPIEIRRNHSLYGAVCEAMECAGAYLSANSMGVPVITVRAISNNELKHQPYSEASGVLAQRFVLELLERL